MQYFLSTVKKPASTRCFTTKLLYIIFLVKKFTLNNWAENIVCNAIARLQKD